MNQQYMNQQYANQQNMNNYQNNGQYQPPENTPSKKYPSRPSHLGKAGAVLNIIIATILLPMLAFFSIIALIELILVSWFFIFVFFVFVLILTLVISSIISNARFLEGKGNKKMAGVLGLLTGSLLGAVFVFCSYRI